MRDSLMALEGQFYGAAMMPPADDEALHRRIQAVARLAGASPAQLVRYWLEWALGGE